VVFVVLTVLVNWLVIYAVLSGIPYGFWYSLLVTAAIIALAVSSVGEWWVRLSLQCRKPTREEADVLRSPWEQATVKLTQKPTLYVSDQQEPNAFAVGRNAVCVTRGLLIQDISGEEIAGVLAHEIGHVVHGDAERRRAAMAMNAVGNALSWVLVGFAALVALLGNVSNAHFVVNLFLVGIALLLKAMLWAVQRLIGLGLMAVGRKEEFRADAYAQSVGLGPGLVSYLRRTEYLTVQQAGVWAALSRTHPPTAVRIDRLTQK
jgi:heat shock protein HtpX